MNRSGVVQMKGAFRTAHHLNTGFQRVTAMSKTFTLFLTGLLFVTTGTLRAQDSDVHIPYEQFVLDNGLTVLVHEDHKAPIVAVNIWYHVGSKNEPEGRSGFAHLFEHLMFNGTENNDDDYFQVLERIGATDLNGTTNEDRTNYFQNVPTSALDVALWMESDRMGHLLGAVTQEKLDEQRGVVQNEKRQGENQPYGKVWNLITEAVYPEGHPYAHTVIGSMDDLNAASLEDVHEWFKTYYGPNNAVLVLAGDIDVETARQKVTKYFGDIPPGPPISHHQTWVARRTGEQRQVLEDRVPQGRLYMVWNVPEAFSRDAHLLELVAGVLTRGKTSRLYKRLVYDEQKATDVSAFVSTGEIGSQFMITATARPGQALPPIEVAIREELERFMAEGPTSNELEKVRTADHASFIRGSERIGGFGGKSDILAESFVMGGSPDAYKQKLADKRQAKPADLKKVASEWLSDGVYVLEVHPFEEGKPVAVGADRSQIPAPGTPPDVRFPAFERRKLSNGMTLIVAERPSVPMVNLTLMFDAGFASDQFGAPGTASLAMNMLDEGTKTRSALEISDDLMALGASLDAGSNLDFSMVNLSALEEQLDPSLDVFADVVLNPSFPESDLARLKQEQLARIRREKVTPMQMGLRVFPKLLYGEGHAYNVPLTGSGTEQAIQGIERSDLQRFHETWFRPNNATLIAVGDITMEELSSKLERLFAGWKPSDVPRKNLAEVRHRDKQTIYLIDRPGSEQSIIFAGHVAPPAGTPEEIAIEAVNEILGGSFTSRINMNLREDKHWSYGAQSLVYNARGQRPFFVFSPVQSDKTKESVQEIAAELRGITTDRPATADELDRVRRSLTLSLPGRWETNRSVASSITQIVANDLPDDYYEQYGERIHALNLSEVNTTAGKVIRPENIVWVVVGDRAKIEPGLKELGFGAIETIAAE